jgi:hypothetical protein
MGSLEHAEIEHLGLCRGLWFGCHILKLFDQLDLKILLVVFKLKSMKSYSAISPRFAMSTEVRGLIVGVIVEL